MILLSPPARAVFQFIGLLTVAGLFAGLATVLALPRLLQVEDAPGQADYIVPLAGEWHRYIKAAELYEQGHAPKILLSNANLREPDRYRKLRAEMGIPLMGSREVRKRILSHLGVPDDAIASFGDGHISTVEEAEALKAYLGEEKARVILVTSPYHTRRARMVFRDVMPRKTFLVTAPPEGRITSRWWRDQKSAQRAVSEGFRFVFYLLGGRFRAHDQDPQTVRSSQKN